MNAQKIITRAIGWLTRIHVTRTAEERQAYLEALQDAEVPQEIVDTIEDAFDSRNAG